MPKGFVKIYETILRSSIWVESPEVRLTWLTLLVECDPTGFYEGSLPGLALHANLPLEEVRKAVAVLESPDLESQDPDNEGRRVKKVERGWMVLNFMKFRELRTQRQVQDAERQKRWRDSSRASRDASREIVTERDSSRMSRTRRQKAETENVSVGSSSLIPSSNTMEEGSRIVPIATDRHGQALTLEAIGNEIDAVKMVFDYWRLKTGHTKAVWNEARKNHLLARLREEPGTLRQKVQGLELAVDGALADPLFNGSKEGTAYTGFENIFIHKGRNRIEKLQAAALGEDAPMPGARRPDDLESNNRRAIEEAIRIDRAKKGLPEGTR